MKRTQWTIEVPKALPSYWQFTKLHWSAKKKMIDLWYTLLLEATCGLTYKKIPCPCTLRVAVFHRVRRVRDCANVGTPLDKLILDSISAPGGNKTRGLGLIPDDDCKHIREVTLVVSPDKAEKDMTVLLFRKAKT